MKFFRAKGLPATTWNPVTNRGMYHFTDGVFETEDPELIKFMQDAGYPSDAPGSKNQVVEEQVMVEADHIAEVSKAVAVEAVEAVPVIAGIATTAPSGTHKKARKFKKA